MYQMSAEGVNVEGLFDRLYTQLFSCTHPAHVYTQTCRCDVFGCAQRTIWGACVIRRCGWRTCVNSSWILCMSDLLLIKKKIKKQDQSCCCRLSGSTADTTKFRSCKKTTIMFILVSVSLASHIHLLLFA